MAENSEPIPEFRPEATEIWSSVGLTVILVSLATYTSWIAASLGSTANFHMTPGILGSWAGICGAVVSLIATVLAWRGFGLNAIAALLGAGSLSSALIDSNLYRVSLSVFLAVGWLVAAIYLGRQYFEHNPFLTFLWLWGLTFASSVSQSIFYRIIFDHSYPLQGVLLLKLLLFGIGGLILLFIFPRKNKVYVI